MRLASWIWGAIAGAAITVAVIAGAGIVAAQDGADTTEERTPFRERVAAHLGISVDELDAAIQAAALDAINDALNTGRITDEQAERMRQRVESGEGLRSPFERHRRHHMLHNIRRLVVTSSAGALGITPEELIAELRAGSSIAAEAAERGVGIDDVRTQVIADADAKLDELVASGRITQERADAFLERFTANLDEILNRTREPESQP